MRAAEVTSKEGGKKARAARQEVKPQSKRQHTMQQQRLVKASTHESGGTHKCAIRWIHINVPTMMHTKTEQSTESATNE